MASDSVSVYGERMAHASIGARHFLNSSVILRRGLNIGLLFARDPHVTKHPVIVADQVSTAKLWRKAKVG